MTALTLYLTQSTSTTASTADTLLENASTGGTLSNKNTNLTSGTTGWIVVYPQGNASAQTGAGSQSALDDICWLDDATTLETNHLNSGTWSFALGFETTTTGTFTADFHFRFFQRVSGGSTRNLIGEAIASSQTIVSGSYTVLTPSVSASASNTFGTGDKLGVKVDVNILTNTTTGNLRMQASSSSSLGNASAEAVSAGYSSVTTSTRTIPTSAVLLSTLTRTIPTSAVLSKFRTIPTSAVLSGPRTIPTSAVLQGTLARTMPTSAALTVTSMRTIPTSAVLYTPATFYASNVASSIGGLTLSDQMSQIIGGTETSFTVTMPSSGTNAYVELTSQGGTPTSNPALPAPTGRGWSISLANNTILAGQWYSVFTLAKSGSSMSGASLIVRWYRRTIDGVCYPIGSATLASQTYSTTKTAYTTPAVQATLWQFISGDTLYVDAFVFNAGTAWASDVFTVYVSNSATQGVSNDGVTFAPTMETTPAGLSCLVGTSSFLTGTTLPVRDQSFTLADALDQRSVLTLTGEDVNGTLSYTPASPVMLSDSAQGLLYTGYLASDDVTRPAAGTSSNQLEHAMTFADHHRDYDKEANEINYSNWTGGDIACDFIQQQQYKNGIWGAFALESDYTPTTFAQGTLAGTVATTTTSPFVYAPNTATPPATSNTGDLELVRSGTQFTLTESVTSDFSSGTLTNMVASNNELTPTTQSAVKVVAVYPSTATGSSVTATESGGMQTSGENILNLVNDYIWSGSMTVASNDTINYDVWISGTSPAFLAGIEVIFSDGTYLTSHDGTLDSATDLGIFDQNGVSVDVLQDLSGYAKDTWYTRNIPLTGMSGKTIVNIVVYIAGSSPGTTTVYIKNCYLGSQSGSPFISPTATAPQYNPPFLITSGGYTASTITTSVVQVYNPLVSYRVSPAHSISGVGLIQNSSITWTASLPTTGGPIPVYPPGTTGTTTSSSGTSTAMVMLVSYDGNTWLQCQNSQALPGLPPGANVSGLSLYLREQFAAGSDPSAIPALLNVQITINSAAAQTTSDIVTAYGTTSQWNTGTQVLTSPNANGNLTLGSSTNPLTQSWPSSAVLTNQTFLAGNNNSGTQAVSGGAYTMTPGASTGSGCWCQSRFDWAGYFWNGTIEADLQMSNNGSPECGVQYRQTGWGNANNNMAYYAAISQGVGVIFGYGSNSFGNTSGTYTSVKVSTQTINNGTYYHLKIVVNGNRHTIYFNHGSTPVIDVLDNAYPNAGQIGFRGYNPTVSFTASIKNFSLVTTTAGTWTSPSTSLASLGTCGYNQVSWTDLDSRGQIETTTIVQSSVDGGTTWMQCTNGAEIPQLTRGTSVSSANLVFQMILSSTTPPISTPVIMGLYSRVCGNFGTVSGTRVSPALSLTPVGYVASSNAMYNANIPTNTTLTVATSQDAATWTTVGNNGAGAALSYWTNQPSATQDLFNSVTSANYTNTSKSGGSAATATYDTTNSRITLSGGSGGLYLNNSITTSDVDLLCDMDESDAGGLVWREVSTSNYYELGVYDASSSGGFTNQLRLYKVASGTRSLLGSASSVTFTRGTFHRIRATMQGGLINIYWDGTCVQSYLDTSPLGSGACGLRNDGGTSRYYQLWIQPLGTNLSGQTLYTKVTMSTSDPSMIPQLFTLVACVRGPSIGTGATIQQLHPVTTPFASYYSAEMDTLVQVSGDYYWYVDRWRQLHFGPRLARPGAFPVQSVADPANASGYLLYLPQVKVRSAADLFRSQQIIQNVTGLVTPPPEIKVADGSTTSWTLGYPVYSAPTILVNGIAATIGVQGIDNNRQFYWQPGSASISYDSSLPKLPSGTIIAITYVGSSTVNVILNNSAAQTAQALVEGGGILPNSGIVAEIEDANSLNTSTSATFGMTTAQATTFGNGLLTRYGNNSTIELVGTTLYPGLVPGTAIALFLPEMLSTWNAQVPLVKLTTTAYQGQNGIIYLYQADASTGPNLSSWQRVWF